MTNRKLIPRLAFTAMLFGCIGYVLAQGQQGLRQEQLAEANLGQHFECLDGMVFRMSRFEIDPDFTSPAHNHLGRPGLFYVLDGSIVEHQNGTTAEYRAGQGFVENANVDQDHRIENSSGSVTTVVYVQIASAEPSAEP